MGYSPNILPVLSVVEYGADPTGVADSGPAIRSAIAACNPKGQTVYFPPGDYMVNSADANGNGVPIGNGFTIETVIGSGFTTPANTSTTFSVTVGTGLTLTGYTTLQIWNAARSMIVVNFNPANYTSGTGVITGCTLSATTPGEGPSGTGASQFSQTITTAMTVSIGNVSTQNGIRLVCDGSSGSYGFGPVAFANDLKQYTARIFAGPAFPTTGNNPNGGACLVAVMGPVAGCGISNLVLDGMSIGANNHVLYLQGAQYGSFDYVSIWQPGRTGLFSTGKAGIFGSSIGSSRGNKFQNLLVWHPGTTGLTAIQLTGSTANGNITPSANTTFCTFYDTQINMDGDPGSGNTCFGVFLGFVDNCKFYGLTYAGTLATPVGSWAYVRFAYGSTSGGSFPQTCHLEKVYGSVNNGPSGGYTTTGSPSSTVTTQTNQVFNRMVSLNGGCPPMASLPTSGVASTFLEGPGSAAITTTPSATNVIFPSGAAGTQAWQTTYDSIITLNCTTTGTAFVLKIGPTSTPTNVVRASNAVTVGDLFSVRLPAGWYLSWTATTAAFATQTGTTCTT